MEPVEPESLVRVLESPNARFTVTICFPEGFMVHRHIDSGILRIGRGRDSDFMIDHVSISRQHGILKLHEQEGIAFRDTGSTNGTFLGDERVIDVQILSGEMFRIGEVTLGIELTQKREQDVPRPERPAIDSSKPSLSQSTQRTPMSKEPIRWDNLNDAKTSGKKERLTGLFRIFGKGKL